MKKRSKSKKKKLSTLSIALLLVLFILFSITIIVLPATQTKEVSYGATIPFTPVPAKSNLQLEWFMLPSPTPQQSSSQPNATIVPTALVNAPTQKAPAAPIVVNPAGPDPATCAGYVNSGVPIPSNCTCPDVYIECPYTTSDPTDVTVGPNGCQDPLFVGDPPKTGKFCIDKPVIYLYPTTPTIVNVTVKTTGYVAVSNPLYPKNGWKNILANPDATFQYNDKQYSELFYETSVTNFQKPTKGITIPTSHLSDRLSTLLDELGLVGHEKEEFLSYWVPHLLALHSQYIFFSLLDPSSKAAIDSVDISPKPDTMIDFIAYFKPVAIPDNGAILQLPPTPQRKGFVAVEWGGVIDR
jgi:hypothetical protein